MRGQASSIAARKRESTNQRSPSSVIRSMLAACGLAVGLLVVLVAAASAMTKRSFAIETGSGDGFVASTTNCLAPDTDSWTSAGYVRGQTIVCDFQSQDTRISGHIEIHEMCPVKADARCDRDFEIQASSGARWKGTYKIETISGDVRLHAEGLGIGDTAGARIVLDIQSLDAALQGGDVWNGTLVSDNVTGQIEAGN